MKQFKWTKNGDGRPDPVLTMAWIGFVAVILRTIVGGFSTVLWGHSISISPLDGGVIMAILTPTLGAYVGNHYAMVANHPFYQKMRSGFMPQPTPLQTFVQPPPCVCASQTQPIAGPGQGAGGGPVGVGTNNGPFTQAP